MSRAQVIHKLGPPKVMQWQDWPVPDPAPGKIQPSHTAIGVNCAEIYHRGGGLRSYRQGRATGLARQLRLTGVCAAYGHVSGPPDPVDSIQDLGQRESLFSTRPAIMHDLAKRSDFERAARDLSKAVSDGILDGNINYQYPLQDAVKAHLAIESGKTLGATVLIP